MKYAIIIEKGKNNYSAFVPDLPGCVSTGKTIEETKNNIHEAILFHIRGLKEDREPIPKPTTLSDYIEVAA
jgi:predicted RNase H-like HicB family nuclease